MAGLSTGAGITSRNGGAFLATAVVHPVLRAAAERQLGLATATDARRAGYGPPEVRRLRASGSWVRMRRGVYSPGGHLESMTPGARHRLDCLAVLLELRRPDAVVSHASAARLQGFPVRRGLERTVRLTAPDAWRHGRGSRLNRAPLATGDVSDTPPLRMTTAARTLIDCARGWDVEDGEVAMDAALPFARTTPAELRSAAAAVRSWPGGVSAVRAVSLTDGRAE